MDCPPALPALGSLAVAPGTCGRGGMIRQVLGPGTQANSRDPLKGTPPALLMLQVTVRVMELGVRVAAGDLSAEAEARALAALLERERG